MRSYPNGYVVVTASRASGASVAHYYAASDEARSAFPTHATDAAKAQAEDGYLRIVYLLNTLVWRLLDTAPEGYNMADMYAAALEVSGYPDGEGCHG